MNTQGLRALVVEDDPDQMFIVASALTRMGMTVVTATSGYAMLDQLAMQEFDIIVTDISMPAMTGVQAVQSARAAGHSAPVVVTTAMQRASGLDEEVAALGGTTTLLYKPFTIAKLNAAVAAILG